MGRNNGLLISKRLKQGDLYMKLLLHRKRRFLTDRGEFNTEFGFVKIKDGLVISSTGEEFLVTDPFFVDMWFNIKRGPQIAHWKDLGLVVVLTGVGPGWKVADVGGGSGFSALLWSNIVGKEGKVIVFENNPKHIRILRRNVEKAKNIEIVEVDPREWEGNEYFQMVFIDIPEPWEIIEWSREHLVPAGFLVAYIPTMEQVLKFVNRLEGFTEPEIHEVIYRRWKTPNTRPLSSGIMHTAFIVLARKMK